MPNVTPNYGLKKPLPEEFYDIGVHNENMDVIDAKLKSIEGASEGIEYLKNINPTTTGYSTLLEYMASRYDDHPVIFGSVGGFSDLPAFSDGDTTAQGCINLCGGILTVTLWLRTETWCRGTNNLTTWTDTWRKVYDTNNKPERIFTATVTTNWIADGDFYYQDIFVEGILDADRPVVDVLMGSDNMTNVTYCETFCKIFRITTLDNSIRVWATEAITTAFPIQLRVVR